MCKLCFTKITLETERPAFVMGIVNVTKDSFYEKSRGGIERAMKLLEEGADIIDLGAESTRPGFTEVSEDDEINALIPVLKDIRKQSSVPVSIDTRKSKVFKACFDEGADIFNDVSALTYDSKSTALAAELKVPVVLMHQGGGSALELKDFFLNRIHTCVNSGILEKDIILDPGIGFGKTNEESIEIIKNTKILSELPYPFMMALSRKRCIGEMTGRDAEERLAGTLAADIFSVMQGAKILRVHDVKETVDTLNVMKFLL